MKRLLLPREYAELARVSLSYVRHKIIKGEIPVIRIGRLVRITEETASRLLGQEAAERKEDEK
jgi:excisionase family DNA binding protein